MRLVHKEPAVRGLFLCAEPHFAAGSRGNPDGVFETKGLSLTNQRSGQSADWEIPMRGVTVTASRGTATP